MRYFVFELFSIILSFRLVVILKFYGTMNVNGHQAT